MAVLTWLARAGVGVGGVLVALLLGVSALLAAAAVAPLPAVFVSAGAVAGLGGWFGPRRLLGRRSRALASRSAAAVGAAAVLAFFAAGLVPLDDPAVPPAVPPGAGTWHLPDGGSLVHGVVRGPDGGPADAAPVVLLHGGPGVPDTAGLLEAFGSLAATTGRDVWAYDQRGTGRSSRLTDPTGYTTALGVSDLDEVRRHIGADRMILVGHSYGAYLAAAYIAEHPDRVERAVFLSPGSLDWTAHGNPQDRLSTAEKLDAYRLMASPRALLTFALVQVDPRAAYAFAGDREADARQDRIYNAAVSALHCPGRTGPGLTGMGFYAFQVPQAWRTPAEPDLTARLGDAGTTPVLVVKGQCDYLDWESVAGYLRAFPDSRLLYLPGAGHDVHVDEPERVRTAVVQFLTGLTVRAVLEDPSRPPAGFQP